jgi:hypothetical protein
MMKNTGTQIMEFDTLHFDWVKLYDKLEGYAKKSSKLRISNMSIEEYKTILESKNYTLLLNRKIRNSADVITTMCIAYSWMPTMLEIYDTDNLIDGIASELSKLDRIGLCSESEKKLIFNLARITNNSIVGAIKTLHLIDSDRYPLIDSRVLLAWKKLFKNNRNVQSLGYSWNVGKQSSNLNRLIEKYFYYRAFIRYWSSNLSDVNARDIEFRFYLSGDRN